MSTYEINKPAVITDFIAFEDVDNTAHWGEVGTINVMTTNRTDLETFTVRQEWIDRLLDFGIEPDA